ncbi:hypothetical protein D3C73_720390 [compost metagenome]
MHENERVLVAWIRHAVPAVELLAVCLIDIGKGDHAGRAEQAVLTMAQQGAIPQQCGVRVVCL